jgi:(R)-2-hydroxyacyl-CoA dehydratese activating ATPase
LHFLEFEIWDSGLKKNRMITAGIDIGSRTIKLVLVKNGQIIEIRKAENTFDTLKVCNGLLEGLSYDCITSTGYGRYLFEEHKKCEVISEIKAFSLGAKFVFPECRNVLDIGGQDTKAILLDEKGRQRKFEMNDKCAAGTGRFLEIMAMTLRYSLEEFGSRALEAKETVSINSMCTVFAESEVVSMLARGADRANVAKGIHQSIVSRSAALLKRIGLEGALVFAGGVAYNKCIIHLLQEQLQTKVLIPEEPQTIGALGAALSQVTQ